MDNPSINNWSNLPRNIIYNIGSYTYKYFLPNLRLINKHWLSAINPIFFYSISDFDDDKVDYIVSKYLGLIGMLDSFDSRNLETMNKIIEQAKCIDEIRWWAGEEPYLDRLLDLLKARKGIKSITLIDDDEHDIEYKGKIKWNNLIDVLKDYSSFESFRINIRCTYLIPMFNSLPLFVIKNLDLKIGCNQVESSIKIILKCDNLRRLKLEIKDGDSLSNDIDLLSLINLSKLIGTNLEYFHLLVYEHKSIDLEIFKKRLNMELFDTFSNPNFSKLKCFDFDFICRDPLYFRSIFTEPLTSIASQWTNLTKMCLFSIDEFLLGHIIYHCPNLRILTFKSPLVMPYNHYSSSLKPLKYLTRMLFGGFHSDILDHKEFIRKIFPSVTTLSLCELYSKPDDVELKAYYIPNLFPDLIKVIFDSTEYNLDELIDSWHEYLTWEELYIVPDKSNEKSLRSLLPKLTKLRNLYVSDIQIDPYRLRDLNFDSVNFKVFIAYLNENTVFDFKIEDEVPLTCV
ncbi:hypothetical protein CONCODRAFT_86264 [Conidiobolus coronatus NRRL 28638]|uniref:F-box domain-containing protein n=1 Tax=Conidiobolus coronatus (strain ATCC 28846 / CBS 209.66 / NRRL 28638) TaxID=796925 RepID=A0A137P1E5_CONC2|nr:hypothetical protein CONCODRAFT_86264 [Conidiobolus coronatus NRRL 28638]|eukprot:KXN68885.1 hypothetical protein CONCODRAFT_86264 [Conidiobolus coronatus NRRL 28638]